MSSITSYAMIPGGTHILGCGYGYITSTLYATDLSASIFRISNDGHLQYFFGITPGASSGINKCYGIAFDNSTNLIYAFMLTKATVFSY